MLKLFIKRIDISGKENIPSSGAVMIASNHPNSFFDAILLACVLDRPLWSLARGDAFKKGWVKSILTKIYMMPIYRLSEGKEYLGENDATFNKTLELFSQNQQVLIFSEGLCTNQSSLLPLKKGTARLAQRAWASGNNLQVMPVGLMYDKFDSFGKVINLNFGKTISRNDFTEINADGFFVKSFNEKLKNSLSALMEGQFKKSNFLNNPIYYIAWLVNFPVYFLCQAISRNKMKGTVFLDSITFALLIPLLLIYWLIIFSILL